MSLLFAAQSNFCITKLGKWTLSEHGKCSLFGETRMVKSAIFLEFWLPAFYYLESGLFPCFDAHEHSQMLESGNFQCFETWQVGMMEFTNILWNSNQIWREKKIWWYQGLWGTYVFMKKNLD